MVVQRITPPRATGLVGLTAEITVPGLTCGVKFLRVHYDPSIGHESTLRGEWADEYWFDGTPDLANELLCQRGRRLPGAVRPVAADWLRRQLSRSIICQEWANSPTRYSARAQVDCEWPLDGGWWWTATTSWMRTAAGSGGPCSSGRQTASRPNGRRQLNLEPVKADAPRLHMTVRLRRRIAVTGPTAYEHSLWAHWENPRAWPGHLPPAGRAEWRTTALRAAHCVAQVGHSRRGDGVDHLQADLPELDAVE